MFEIDDDTWADRGFTQLTPAESAILRTQFDDSLRSSAVLLGLAVLADDELPGYFSWIGARDTSWRLCAEFWAARSPESASALPDRAQSMLSKIPDADAVRRGINSAATGGQIFTPQREPRRLPEAELLAFADNLIAGLAEHNTLDRNALNWQVDPVIAVSGWPDNAPGTDWLRSAMKCDLAALIDRELWDDDGGVNLAAEIARRLGDSQAITAVLTTALPDFTRILVDTITAVTDSHCKRRDALVTHYTTLRTIPDAVWSRANEIRAASISRGITARPLRRRTGSPERRIDAQLLASVGLDGLPEDQMKGLLEHFYSQLEHRTGEALSHGLTNRQLADFEKLIDIDDELMCTAWLDINRPDYPEQVDQIYLQLTEELRAAAPTIQAQLGAG